jgi:hypothetical protein
MARQRPPVDFHQQFSVLTKALENTVLGLLDALVREKVLSKQQALAAFSNIPAPQGVNNPHEIGLTLKNLRDVLEWHWAETEKQQKNSPAVA